MATEKTATGLNSYIAANFVSGTGAFKMTTLVTMFQDLIESIYVAISKTKYQSLSASVEASVNFDTAFSAGSSYQLIWWAYDSNGDPVTTVRITDMTVSGFKATAVADCTFHYYAIKNN